MQRIRGRISNLLECKSETGCIDNPFLLVALLQAIADTAMLVRSIFPCDAGESVIRVDDKDTYTHVHWCLQFMKSIGSE